MGSSCCNGGELFKENPSPRAFRGQDDTPRTGAAALAEATLYEASDDAPDDASVT